MHLFYPYATPRDLAGPSASSIRHDHTAWKTPNDLARDRSRPLPRTCPVPLGDTGRRRRSRPPRGSAGPGGVCDAAGHFLGSWYVKHRQSLCPPRHGHAFPCLRGPYRCSAGGRRDEMAFRPFRGGARGWRGLGTRRRRHEGRQLPPSPPPPSLMPRGMDHSRARSAFSSPATRKARPSMARKSSCVGPMRRASASIIASSASRRAAMRLAI